MESRSERICSEEKLGMVPQQFDPAAPNFNQVLVPPVMSAQIELIMTAMVLLPLKKAVLTQLQELIKANRARSWFTIYLCLFVLLHSCALLTSFENMQAMKYGLQVGSPQAPEHCSSPKINSLVMSTRPSLRNYTTGLKSCLHTSTIATKVAIHLPQTGRSRETLNKPNSIPTNFDF